MLFIDVVIEPKYYLALIALLAAVSIDANSLPISKLFLLFISTET